MAELQKAFTQKGGLCYTHSLWLFQCFPGVVTLRSQRAVRTAWYCRPESNEKTRSWKEHWGTQLLTQRGTGGALQATALLSILTELQWIQLGPDLEKQCFYFSTLAGLRQASTEPSPKLGFQHKLCFAEEKLNQHWSCTLRHQHPLHCTDPEYESFICFKSPNEMTALNGQACCHEGPLPHRNSSGSKQEHMKSQPLSRLWIQMRELETHKENTILFLKKHWNCTWKK